jgi:hypothetical protein
LDHGGEQFPVIRRSDVSGYPHVLWPHIVRALTAGPTLESARVVIDTLREEIAALTAANRDLNAELNGLRRANDRG